MVTNNKELNFQEALHILPEFDFEHSESDRLVTQCAWCRRYQWADGSYSYVSPLIPSEGINSNITHSICPECKEKVLEGLQCTSSSDINKTS